MSRSIALLSLLLSACAAPPAEEVWDLSDRPVDYQPPPGVSGMILSGPTDVDSGDAVVWSVRAFDLNVGDRVDLAWGGTLGAGPCPFRARTGGTLCLDITGPVRQLATTTAVADPAAPGQAVAEFAFTVPALARSQFYLQAIKSTDPATSATTQPVLIRLGTDTGPTTLPAAPTAADFMWQGVQDAWADPNCVGTVTAGIGDNALCYTAADGKLMCSGFVFNTDFGPGWADAGLSNVEQIFVSRTFNAANGNAMCGLLATGELWCMGNTDNVLHGYPSTDTSPTFEPWGSDNDIVRIATGTWDTLCALHEDGKVDCSGYGIGPMTSPVVETVSGATSVWVTTFGTTEVDDLSTFRAEDGRTECTVTAAGADCRGSVSGVAGEVVQVGGGCVLDTDGVVGCSTCKGTVPANDFFCGFNDPMFCSFDPSCQLVDEQHFSAAPALLLVSHYDSDRLCAVLNDGSMWCYGRNAGAGMFGTGSASDLAVDTQVVPPGGVRIPTCPAVP